MYLAEWRILESELYVQWLLVASWTPKLYAEEDIEYVWTSTDIRHSHLAQLDRLYNSIGSIWKWNSNQVLL